MVSAVAAALVAALLAGAGTSRAESGGSDEIYSIKPDGQGLVDLSNDPANDRFPVESPRGGRIAFVSDRDGYDAVYLMNDDGSQQRRLTDRLTGRNEAACRLGPPVWSPQGSTIAFDGSCRSIHDDPRSFDSSVYVVSSSGGAVRGLVAGGANPSFSADGRFVAYTSQPNVIAPMTVGVVAADGGAPAAVGLGSSPAWSPRGHRLAFAWEKRGLAVVDAATSSRRWVFARRVNARAGWSPDGQLLAFFLGGARPGIYAVRPGGRRARWLVDLPEPSSVNWSPDGRWLALRGSRSTFVVTRRGRYLRSLGGQAAEPAWSPDSSFVASADPSAGGVAVTKVPGEVTMLLAASPAIFGLTWTRDSRRLIFASTPLATPY
jgi:Tol biopolymer transport system component